MLNSINVVRSHTLSKQSRHSPSRCLRRYYYNPRRAASPPTLVKDENDSLAGRPSLSLPTSPFLDAEVVDAKQKLQNKQPKPTQNAAQLTDFQKRLAINPYAHALATPVRQCYLTSAKLPRHFLLTFGTEFHPKPAPNGSTKLAPRIAFQADKVTPGHKTNVVALRSSLQSLGKKKGWQRLVNKDMHDKFRIKEKKEWDYPSDMEAQVLDHLRRSAFQKLKWAFNKPSAKLVRPFDASENVSAAVACILQLRLDGASPALHGLSCPNYNLPALLGEALLKELLENASFIDASTVTLAESPLTLSMQLRLLRLQTFLQGENKLSY